MANKYRVKISQLSINDLTVGGHKSVKTLYVKVQLDKSGTYLTYAEKNTRDTLEWFSTFNANFEFDEEVEELKNKSMTCLLYEKPRGVGAEDLCLGGIEIDFFTLATGPGYIDLPLQSADPNLSGRLKLTVEFEHFSEANITFGAISVEVDPNPKWEELNYVKTDWLRLGFTCEDLPDVVWKVNKETQIAYKDRKTAKWEDMNPTLSTVLSARTILSGLYIQAVTLLRDVPTNLVFNIPLSKYASRPGRAVQFFETMNDKDGKKIGQITGTLTINDIPTLAQMAAGLLTEKGVQNPTVVFPRSVLPSCVIYRVKEERDGGGSSLAWPWVRVNVFDGSHYYLNNVTLEKTDYLDPNYTSSKMNQNTSAFAATGARGESDKKFVAPYFDVEPPKVVRGGPMKYHPLNVKDKNLNRSELLAVEKAKNIHGWVCEVCTLANEGTTDVCTLCGSIGPYEVAAGESTTV